MTKYPIFSVLGLEIEYMLIDKDNLQIRPVSDVILKELAGHQTNSFTLGEIEISNELVMHVIELKNAIPHKLSTAIENHFQDAIMQLQPILNEHNLQLLPTGAHFTMDPHKETKRWPHGDRSIYKQFDKIFDCRGHGWANLQSMHINLPFANDTEFSALHNTIRILLPLIPALAASTPIIEGKPTGYQCTRMLFYEQNQQILPSISGKLIPEFITSEAQYFQDILYPMYRDISPHDPKGILQYEWLNSRGAIPKFERNSIEIRCVDTQECVHADIAIAKMIHHILEKLYETSDYHLLNPYDTDSLKMIHDQTIKEGLSVEISDNNLLAQWQLPKKKMTVREIWSKLIEQVSHKLTTQQQKTLEHILNQGNLSERILKACNNDYSKKTLDMIERNLSECLLHNKEFS